MRGMRISSRAARALTTTSLTIMMTAFTLAACSSGEKSGPVTLAIVNARIWTGNPKRPWAEAIAVRGDRIATIGSSAEIQKMTGRDAQMINAHGQMLVPGFIDAHTHIISAGRGLSSVKLRDAKTPAEFITRIRDYVKTIPKGAWVTDGDWDHTLWGGELPTRQWIDSVSPDNPVWVSRLAGHMSLANSAALGAAPVQKATPNFAGGLIVRDANGEPTGLLKEKAQGAGAGRKPRACSALTTCRRDSRSLRGPDSGRRPACRSVSQAVSPGWLMARSDLRSDQP